ncbi:MAG: MarR family transcriptional regulator [Clostridia bacterium]|nr:MarR family transcriptional regulator [Clostridia bacterium]
MSTKSSMYVYILLNKVLNALKKENYKLISEYGLTLSQFAVLEALYTAGELTTGEVMKKVLTTSGNIPVIVKNLAKEGYITRRQSGNDKRKYMLNLSEKGQRLMEELAPKNINHIEKSVSIWNEEEKRDLIRLLNKFRKDFQ